MPQIDRYICRAAAFLCLFLAGCGGGSETGRVFVPGQGHEGTWPSPFAIGSAGFHGTAVKEVAQGPAGSALYLLHCAACHGEDAKGKIGPNIQGIAVSFITAAINVIPIMRGHSTLPLEDQEEIAAYLDLLARGAEPSDRKSVV